MRQHSPFSFLRSQVTLFIEIVLVIQSLIHRIYNSRFTLPDNDLSAFNIIMKAA